MDERINQLIPMSISAINKHIATNGEVPKVYKGYISSMGASIIQAGLLPTLAFYTKSDGKEADPKHLLNAIYDIIKAEDDLSGSGLETYKSHIVLHILDQCGVQISTEIAAVKDLDKDAVWQFEERISRILIGLKLALRTFKINE